jgi:hypothetical protein
VAIKMTRLDKKEFTQKHLKHRLTLLRTLRERKKNGYLYDVQNDIYRCVKDSSLIAVRLLSDFLGFRVKFENGHYSLTEITEKQKRADDVRLDKFVDKLLCLKDLSIEDQRILWGVLIRADKELAYITSKFDDEFNTEEALIKAATIVEHLLKKNLYDALGEELPEMD